MCVSQYAEYTAASKSVYVFKGEDSPNEKNFEIKYCGVRDFEYGGKAQHFYVTDKKKIKQLAELNNPYAIAHLEKVKQ